MAANQAPGDFVTRCGTVRDNKPTRVVRAGETIVQDAPLITDATSDRTGVIDWTDLGSFIRRTATIATIEHLHQQQVNQSGGMMPAGKYGIERESKRETTAR